MALVDPARLDAVAFDLPPLEPPPPPPPPPEDPEVVRETLLAQARAEADAVREAARAEGWAAGHAEGVAALQDSIALVADAAQQVAGLRAEVCDAVERSAVDLALRIAEQALHGAVAADPTHVVDVVRGALRRLVERDRVTILVNPEDLDRVRAAAPELVGQLGGIEHCEVQAERRVSPGGAIVRTVEGEVDATLETKLERVREALTESVAEVRAQDDDEDPLADVG